MYAFEYQKKTLVIFKRIFETYCIYTGFVQSLEFLKKSGNLRTTFPDLEKVWKLKAKSWKMGWSLEFFSKSSRCHCKLRTKTAETVFFLFLFVVFIIKTIISSRAMKNFTVILSLENKKNGLEKVWKKSWILFTKKCTNPVYNKTFLLHSEQGNFFNYW